MTTSRANAPVNRDGTYEIIIASIQALNTKVTELGATLAAMVDRFDDFQRSVETRYMPRTEFDVAMRESQEDRKDLRSMMVYRDAYLASQQEATRRLERLENGPQRLIGWLGVGIGCAGLMLSGLGILVTAILWLVLR